MNQPDPRRHAPRVAVEGFCGVVSRDHLHHAAMLDLSMTGLRLERVFDPATANKVVQLEIELPGIDEIVWATAAVTRAYLSPLPKATPDAPQRFWCRAGLRITDASRRERSMLMGYVVDSLRRSAASAPHPRTLTRGELAAYVARAPRVS